MFCSIAILKQAATGDQFAVDQLKEINKQRARKAELDDVLKREVEEILRLRQVNAIFMFPVDRISLNQVSWIYASTSLSLEIQTIQ